MADTIGEAANAGGGYGHPGGGGGCDEENGSGGDQDHHTGGPIEDCPDEILVNIVEYCGIFMLGSMARVSRRWNRICNDPVVRASLFRSADLSGSAWGQTFKYKVECAAALRLCSVSLSTRLADALCVFEANRWKVTTGDDHDIAPNTLVRADPTVEVPVDTSHFRFLLSEACFLGISLTRSISGMFTDTYLTSRDPSLSKRALDPDVSGTHDQERWRLQSCFFDYAIASGNREIAQLCVDYGAYERTNVGSTQEPVICADYGLVHNKSLDFRAAQAISAITDRWSDLFTQSGRCTVEITPEVIRVLGLRRVNPLETIFKNLLMTHIGPYWNARSDLDFQNRILMVVEAYVRAGHADNVAAAVTKYSNLDLNDPQFVANNPGAKSASRIAKKVLESWDDICARASAAEDDGDGPSGTTSSAA